MKRVRKSSCRSREVRPWPKHPVGKNVGFKHLSVHASALPRKAWHQPSLHQILGANSPLSNTCESRSQPPKLSLHISGPIGTESHYWLSPKKGFWEELYTSLQYLHPLYLQSYWIQKSIRIQSLKSISSVPHHHLLLWMRRAWVRTWAGWD